MSLVCHALMARISQANQDHTRGGVGDLLYDWGAVRDTASDAPLAREQLGSTSLDGGYMKILWCWRCRQDMPMLDEDEYRAVAVLYSACTREVKTFRQVHDALLSQTPVYDLFEPVRQAYERMTGMTNCHQDAIMHHRISIYGPPCCVCGKPLRTPLARFCVACGESVQAEG